MFLSDQNFIKKSKRGSTKEHPRQIITKYNGDGIRPFGPRGTQPKVTARTQSCHKRHGILYIALRWSTHMPNIKILSHNTQMLQPGHYLFWKEMGVKVQGQRSPTNYHGTGIHCLGVVYPNGKYQKPI